MGAEREGAEWLNGSGQLGRTDEAKAELDELLALVPNFPTNARSNLRWVGSGEFPDLVIDGLRKAGLDIPDEPRVVD